MTCPAIGPTDAAPGAPSGTPTLPLPDPLVWLDLEMTGLDVRRHVIVEIAVVVTTSALEVLDEGLDIVVGQPPEALAEMDEAVREMHARSGLLDEIERSSAGLADAADAVLAYLEPRVGPPGSAPLCGNSIGVDRRFLDHHLPELDRYFHYRSIDVSSLKELCRRWYPDVYRRRPAKRERHRARDDVLESIAELRFYRDEILRPPDTPRGSTGAPDADPERTVPGTPATDGATG